MSRSASTAEDLALSAADARRLFADWKHVSALVLAVSGGPDSTALLWLAAKWRNGLRHAPKLLADMDPYTGIISFILKAKSTYSFLDVLNHSDALDNDLWKAMVTQRGGVDVLLSPESMVGTETVVNKRSWLVALAALALPVSAARAAEFFPAGSIIIPTQANYQSPCGNRHKWVSATGKKLRCDHGGKIDRQCAQRRAGHAQRLERG